MPTMPLYDAVHLGEAKPRAHVTLGREERLKGALQDFGGHADARVADFDANVVIRYVGENAKRSTRLHRIECILHQIEQRLAQFARNATHVRFGRELTFELDLSAARAFGPEWTRH